MRVVAALFALVAVVLLVIAIAGMVTGRPGARTGTLIRALALLFFIAAVALNIAAH